MTVSLTIAQLNAYRALIQANGASAVKQVYGELYDKGFQYAGWANGVAQGNSITGQAALGFLDVTSLMGYGGQAAKNLSQAQVDNIRVDMALGFLSALENIANNSGGAVNRDVTFMEAKSFHSDVFSKNGLTINNWTLTIPFELITSKYGQSQTEVTWQTLRDTGGDGPYAIAQSISLMGSVLSFALNGNDSETRNKALTWATIVPFKQIANFLIRYFEGGGTTLPWSNSALPVGTAGLEDFQKALLTVVADYFDLTPSGATTLFDSAGGRLSFDYDQITTDTGQLRSLPLLIEAASKFDAQASGFIRSYASDSQSWHIQSGTSALNWTAADATNNAAIGGTDADSETGGTGNDLLIGLDGADSLQGKAGSDLLVGGEGADTLDGGDGSDYLYGGNGADTYSFSGTFGNDWIKDSDGQGEIQFDGNALPSSAAKKVADNLYRDKASGWSFFKSDVQTDGSATLIISKDGSAGNSITVRNWTNGQLGINLSDTKEDTPTGLTIFKGDQRALQYGIDRDLPSSATLGDYAWAYSNWLSDGTLTNSKAQADFADVIKGSNNADSITGLGGNDALSGNAGDDIIDGGAGDDLIGGGAGSDTIRGGTGNDEILGGLSLNVPLAVSPTATPWAPPGGEKVYMKGPTWGVYQKSDGKTYIIVGASGAPQDAKPDFIEGGAGNDRILASFGNDYVDGGDDDDEIKGLAGSDVLYGGAGADHIYGDALSEAGWLESTPSAQHGNDILDGGKGNDELVGQGGRDELFGGEDNDSLWGDDTETKGTELSAHDNDYLDGGAGDDQLVGGGKDDELFGGSGNDKLFGDDDQKIVDLSYQGKDYLDGEQGNDYLSGGGNDDELFGGEGNDSLWGDDTQDIVAASAHGRDYLDGEDGDDQLTGGGEADELFGGAGNDIMRGDDIQTRLDVSAHGKDYLNGEEGNDQLIGGGDADELFGGSGNDSLWGDDDQASVSISAHGNDYLDGGEGDDQLTGGGKDDQLFGGLGNDTLFGDGTASKVDVSAHGNDYLDGGDGNDALIGGGGSDTLEGGAGHDVLYGDEDATNTLVSSAHGADNLSGGDGNDTLYGGGGGDILHGDAGNDWLSGEDQTSTAEASQASSLTGNDTLYGDAGNDTMLGGMGNDVLDGGADADILLGGDGTDSLTGGDGNDYLSGGEGNDTLRGGSGDDTLNGGNGRDLYVFGAGSGTDVVSETTVGGGNAINLDGITNTASATFTRTGSDLTIVIGTSDKLAFSGFFDDALNSVILADGQVLNVDQITGLTLRPTTGDDTITGYGTNDSIYGDAGNDFLSGGTGNDTLDGGLGNDTLVGGAGADTYFFGRGSGQDTISNADSDAIGVNMDTIQVGSSIAAADLTLQRLSGGNDLVIGIKGTADMLTVLGYFSNDGATTSAVENLKFADNTVWNVTTVKAKMLAPTTGGNDYLVGYDSNDSLNGGTGNDTLSGGAGNDTLDGGADNDSLAGGDGADTYLFGKGSGQDIVSNGDGDALGTNPDTIQLGSGITAADLILQRKPYNNDLIVKINGSTDTLTILNYFYNNSVSNSVVENIKFADGAVWDVATVKAKVKVLWPTTSGDDYVNGSASADNINGGDGNDSLNGNEGNDTLDGGTGNDSLDGGSGNDIIDGGSGDDTITGQSEDDMIFGGDGDDQLDGGPGDDTLNGGAGEDFLYGGSGNNTYMFGKLDGSDFVQKSAYDTVGSLSTTGSLNTLLFKEGVSQADIRLSHPQSIYSLDLVVSIVGTSDEITIANFYYSYGCPIQQFKFSDGTIWSLGEIQERSNKGDETDQFLAAYPGGSSLSGLGGDDTLKGGSGNDTLDGGAGNDYLNGSSGDNVYLFGKGDGRDFVSTLFNNSPNRLNTLQFKSGVSDKELIVRQSVINSSIYLVISIADTTDTITFSNFFQDGYDSVQQIKFADGATWNMAKILTMAFTGTTGADRLSGTSRNDTMNGGAGDDILSGYLGNDSISGGEGSDKLVGEDGNDTLDGGTGNDTLLGGAGSDYYYVDSANDIVIEQAPINETDNADVIETTVTYHAPDNIEELWAARDAVGVDLYASANGTELWGNNRSNHLYGSDKAEILCGVSGPDSLYGGGGDDLYYFVAGKQTVIELADQGTDSVLTCQADTTLADNVERLILFTSPAINGTGNKQDNYLQGNRRDNLLQALEGNDQINAGDGNDTLVGGAGNDLLVGAFGNDTYQFTRGDGADQIIDTDATAGNQDHLSFDASIANDQLWFSKSGQDLLIQVVGSTDQVSITNWYQGAANQVEFIEAGGKSLKNTQVNVLVDAMSTLTPPAAGQTTLSADTLNKLAPALKSAWGT